MKKKTKKKLIYGTATVLAVVGLFYLGRKAAQSQHQPQPKMPKVSKSSVYDLYAEKSFLEDPEKFKILQERACEEIREKLGKQFKDVEVSKRPTGIRVRINYN